MKHLSDVRYCIRQTRLEQIERSFGNDRLYDYAKSKGNIGHLNSKGTHGISFRDTCKEPYKFQNLKW